MSRPMDERPKTLYGLPISWSDEISGPPQVGNEIEEIRVTKPNYFLVSCGRCYQTFLTSGLDACPRCGLELPDHLKAT